MKNTNKKYLQSFHTNIEILFTSTHLYLQFSFRFLDTYLEQTKCEMFRDKIVIALRMYLRSSP